MAQNRIDFERIKREVPIAKIAEYCGLPPTSKDQIRCRCPACDTDDPRSLAVTKSIGSFYCHATKLGGDATGLLAHIKGIGQRAAAELIMEELLGNSNTAASRNRHIATASRRAPVPDKRTQGGQVERQSDSPAGMPPLDYLDATHEDVEALGFTVDDAERLGVGFANKGILRGLVAIPLRDDQGILVGYAGVAEGRIGKLHFPNIVPFPNKRRA